jgi:hypothetical protein
MKLYRSCAALVVVLAMGACDLQVGNPNAPDAPRAFSDPAGLEGLLSGALRTWVATRENYDIMALNMQADNYTASWNNAAIRFYSSVGSDCPSRCGWTNSSTAPEAAGGPAVEAAWYGYHTVLSSANDVLGAVARGICFDTDCSSDSTKTKRAIALGKMLQGMAIAGIAMIYDSGFAVDETTDLSNLLTLPFSSRAALRDFALAKFNDAYAAAAAPAWTSESDWFGLGGGTYTNVQIQQLVRTMQAELIAMWPRNGTENAAADWASVATYASQGVSSGTPYDWSYEIDVNAAQCGVEELSCVKTWGNSYGTVRVDTRVAAMITTNHQNPWPEPAGNPCPTTSPDRRVGDGSFGPVNDPGLAMVAATVNAGSDFACSGVAIFPPARGMYHQSNLTHIRYNHLAYDGERSPAFPDGAGPDPLYTRQMNDLLQAEGLLRSGGSKPTAAALINNSRVGRGGAGCATPGVGGCGLLPLTGAETDTAMYDALHYEQEIEFMGQGQTPYFNRRRAGTLTSGTPRQMPVPAKEMDVLLREIYTFGGPTGPDMSAASGGGARVRSVGEIFKEIRQRSYERSKRKS